MWFFFNYKWPSTKLFVSQPHNRKLFLMIENRSSKEERWRKNVSPASLLWFQGLWPIKPRVQRVGFKGGVCSGKTSVSLCTDELMSEWVCVCVLRMAVGRYSAAVLWGRSETLYVAAARCWWRNCRATYRPNLAAPSKRHWQKIGLLIQTVVLNLSELLRKQLLKSVVWKSLFCRLLYTLILFCSYFRSPAWRELLPWIFWTKPATTRSR